MRRSLTGLPAGYEYRDGQQSIARNIPGRSHRLVTRLTLKYVYDQHTSRKLVRGTSIDATMLLYEILAVLQYGTGHLAFMHY